MIPNNITKEHLEKAIAEIDKDGVRTGRHSSTYDLIYNGKTYPPKLIISIANRFANGKELNSNNFVGGKETAAFNLFKKEGFKIVKKGDYNHYKIIKEYIDELNSSKTKAANSIIKLIAQERFEENLQKVDQYFFDNKLKIIDTSNYQNLISFLQDIHKIKSGVYNDFNIWSASKTYLQKSNPRLIIRHDELNEVLGFPDNGNGLYKSFLGQNNLIRFITNKFSGDRKSIYDSLRNKMVEAGFKFETEQVPQRQKRKEKEIKFVHPTLIAKFDENNLKINATKFYLKPLSDEPDCEIGLVTGKTSPLLTEDIFIKPNTRDTYNDNPAWSNKENDFTLDNLLKSISSFINTQENNMSFPLNTIFYGPPGTGKTYNTILRAAQIIENRVIGSYNEALQVFKTNLHNRIEFITFHQNYSYEDFIQGLRPDTENDNQLTFERKDGVFKEIADKALKNLTESEKPELLKRQFVEVFNQFINPLVEGEIEEIEVKMKKVSFFITAISNKSIDFRKASGGSGHTLSIGTLKKMYLAESVLEMQGLASYYTPLLAELLKLGKHPSGNTAKIKRKNYVIIIDEINRANISRVFGELITLIEPDKRSHGSIPLEARLPSGDTFIVPSNLFIIGTMNTADKSIALLDIALRRRFEFESMYPQYKIDDQVIYDVDILKKINTQIIKSKGHDFQIGHAYFMGENNDLIERMNKKVIPLLLEYYMNDEKEVKRILNSAGLKIEDNSWPLKISGKND
jgi:hypothetical protein